MDADPEEEEVTTGASSDFDYLLGMAIWSLTHEKVRALRFMNAFRVLTTIFRLRNCLSKVGRKRRSYLRYSSCLLSNSGTQIWINSSRNGRCVLYMRRSFKPIAHKRLRSAPCKEWDDSAIKDSTGKAVKRKQTTLKTRKSLSGPGKKRKDVSDNEGSDDDFMPSKAVAKSAPKRGSGASGAKGFRLEAG